MKNVSVLIKKENIEEILGTVGSPSIVLSELIKNSIDSNSENVEIYINTYKKEIKVVDFGDGLDEEEIKKLGDIGVSVKKEYGNETRKNGEYYSGSKGLGLLSSFSLCSNIEIKTRKKDKSYIIKWEKSQGKFNYYDIDNLPHCGTQLTMNNISSDDIRVLTDEEEYKKLRHITICHFKNASIAYPKINYYIDGKLKTDFTCCDIKQIDYSFVYKINFSYCSKYNKLKFKFDSVDFSKSNKIDKDKSLPTFRLLKNLTIDLNNNLDLNSIVKENYKITKIHNSKKSTFKYLYSNLEDFEGMFYVVEGRKDNQIIKNDLYKFGHGVKVFVNNFAIYSYLDNDNDWLGFGYLSQLGKATTLKPHNVFGYINFNNFNEKKSSLEIANERANFIEKASYKKFIEIVKDIIVKIAYDVDVAYRNNYIDIPNYNFTDNKKNTYTIIDGSKNKEINSIKADDNNNESQKKPSSIESPLHNSGNNVNTKKISNSANRSEQKLDIKNPNNSNVKLRNKPKFNFFNTSTILKTKEKITIDYNELIKQLKNLSQLKEFKYSDFYLIFVVTFRSILEDISKTYINTRKLVLNGDFGQNIKTMTDDIASIIRDPNYIDKKDKEEIERIFGGFNAYKNFLDSTGNDFYCNGKQGIKATKLNSFVHTPRWMEPEEAESISNDIILPLIISSEEILKRIKK